MKIKILLLLIFLSISCLIVFNVFADEREPPLQYFGWDEISLTKDVWNDLWNYIFIDKNTGETTIKHKTNIEGNLTVKENLKVNKKFCLDNECHLNFSSICQSWLESNTIN